MSRLLNSDSLKTLLGTGHERVKKSQTIMAHEILNTILMEETGGVIRKIKRNDKKKKKKKRERQSAFDSTLTENGIERALLQMLVHHNIYEYADTWQLPRAEVEAMEKNFKDCNRQAAMLETKLRLACEELGNGDSVLDEEGVQIALEYTGLHESSIAEEIVEKLGTKASSKSAIATDRGLMPGDKVLYEIKKVPHYTKSKLLINNLVESLSERRRGHSAAAPAPHLSEISHSQSAYFNDLLKEESTHDTHRPTSHPELSLVSDMTSFMYSQSDRVLPPIKVPAQSTSTTYPSRPRKRLLDAAGFDEAYTRETPRVLHYDNAENHDPIRQVGALRRELQMAKAGVTQLTKMVDKNIAWVQQNCDMGQYGSQISERARKKCRLMATDRIANVFAGLVHRTLDWGLKRWRSALKFEHCKQVATQYCKAKGIIGLTRTLYRWHLRYLHKRWKQWINLVKEQIKAEREAASIKIQKIIRGFLGRRRVLKKKMGMAAIRMQCLFRKMHAVNAFRRKRVQKQLELANAAAATIQNLARRFVQIRKAKAELQRRRDRKAAVRIQKIARGRRGRDSFHQKQMEMKRQKELEEANAREEAIAKAEAQSKAKVQALAEARAKAEAQARAEAQAKAELERKKSAGTDLEALAVQKPYSPAVNMVEEEMRADPSQPVLSKMQRSKVKIAEVTSHGHVEDSGSSPDQKSISSLNSRTKGSKNSRKPLNSSSREINSTKKGQGGKGKALEHPDEAAIKIQKITRGKMVRAKSIKALESPKVEDVLSDDFATNPVAENVDIVPPSKEESIGANDLSHLTENKKLEEIVTDDTDSSVVAYGNEEPSVKEKTGDEETFNSLELAPFPVANYTQADCAGGGVSGLSFNTPLSVAQETIPLSARSDKSNMSNKSSSSQTHSPSKGFLGALASPLKSASGFSKNAFGSFSGGSKKLERPSSSGKSTRIDQSIDENDAQDELDRDLQHVQTDDMPVVSLEDNSSSVLQQQTDSEILLEPSQPFPFEEQNLETSKSHNDPDVQLAENSVYEKLETEAIENTADVSVDTLPEQASEQHAPPNIDNEGDQRPHLEQENQDDHEFYETTSHSILTHKEEKTKEKKKTAAQRSAEAQKKLQQDRIAQRSKDLEDKKKVKKDAKQSKPTPKNSKSARKNIESHSEDAMDESKDKNKDEETSKGVSSFKEESSKELQPRSTVGAATPSQNLNDDVNQQGLTKEDSQKISTMKAATTIQLMLRRLIARKRLQKRKEQVLKAQEEAVQVIDWATVTIQRNLRGKIGRKRFHYLKVEKETQVQKKASESAVKIQSRMRGMHERKKVAQVKVAKVAEKKHVDWLKSYQKQSGQIKADLKVEEGEVDDEAEDAVENFSRQESGSKSSKSGRIIKGGSRSRPPSSSEQKRVDMPSLSRQPSTQKPRTPNTPKTPSKPPVERQFPGQSSTHPHPPTSGVPHADHVASIPPPAHSPRPAAEASPAPQVHILSDPRLDTLDERLKKLEEVEKRIKESEENLATEAKKAEERIQQQLAVLEEKARQAEVERRAREDLMKLAVGQLSHRSPFASLGPQSARRTSGFMMSTRTSAPPTARSAREGNIPVDSPKLIYQGQEWLQLWDDAEQAYYWWCAATQAAQWEQPGMEQYYQQQYYPNQQQPATVVEGKDEGDESGYESSGGALTDYSTDHDVSYYDEGAGQDDWQEYWDEQAQAKYWYNNATGEASWTKPAQLESKAASRVATASDYSGGNDMLVPAPANANNGWVSYIDEETGQLYWHNVSTGEVRWDY